MIGSRINVTGNVYLGDHTFPEDLKNDYGVAISGGGTRSAALAAGQLRAMINAGLFGGKKGRKYTYVSMVSGGSWGAFPLFYLPNDSWVDHYLGQTVKSVDTLTLDFIAKNAGLVAQAVSHDYVALDTLWHILKWSDAYCSAIGDTFLRPMGIDENKFVTWRIQDRDQLVNLNQPSKNGIGPGDFLCVLGKWRDQDVPFPIVNGTVLTKDHLPNLHFEITPLYVGISGDWQPSVSGPGFGGGKVSPILMGTDIPSAIAQAAASGPGTATAYLGAPSIALYPRDVIGISGDAPAGALSGPFFPYYQYWSPDYDNPKNPSRKEVSYEFGDGGLIENFGIMPLLRRQVQKIVVFINAEYDIGQLNLQKWLEQPDQIDDSLDDAIAPLFHPKALNRIKKINAGQNVVFDINVCLDSKGKPVPGNSLFELVTDLHQKAAAGEIAFHTAKYQVVPNPNYGVDANSFGTAHPYQPTVTWVYNCLPNKWLNALPHDTLADPNHLWRKPGLKPFPFEQTFFEEPPFVVNLSVEEGVLLGHLADWVTSQLIQQGEI
jgi:hypothetical protein